MSAFLSESEAILEANPASACILLTLLGIAILYAACSCVHVEVVAYTDGKKRFQIGCCCCCWPAAAALSNGGGGAPSTPNRASANGCSDSARAATSPNSSPNGKPGRLSSWREWWYGDDKSKSSLV